MKSTINFEGHAIEYEIKLSKRTRTVRLTVSSNGAVTVTIPYTSNPNRAEQFVKIKAPWILRKLAYFKKFTQLTPAPMRRAEIENYKRQTRRLVTERLRYFNQFYNFTVGRISIRNQKTLWGSCSRKGNLNFNFRLALLPSELSDYVIVHELCHRGQFNHSQKFWDLVGQTLPDYAQLKKTLRAYKP